MQNILFIGGAGFIGSSLINTISSTANNSIKIFILETHNANISRLQNPNIEIYYGNLTNYEKIKEIISKNKIEIVVHLVSTLLPSSKYQDYENEMTNVISPTIRLLKYCSENNIKFIYFSSGGTIYGNNTEVSLLKETNNSCPISYYGLSKEIIESHIYFFHRYANLEYLILRPSNPYGIGQNIYGKQGLIAVALGKILSHQPIEVYGSGESIRDYIYIEDLSQIFLSILNQKITNETINISTGIGYSINEILYTIKKIVDEECIIKHLPSRKEDVSNVVLDNYKLMSLISFKFTMLEEGILATYKAVRNTTNTYGKH